MTASVANLYPFLGVIAGIAFISFAAIERSRQVGTEEWRNDLSDVVLPTPEYDSDSD